MWKPEIDVCMCVLFFWDTLSLNLELTDLARWTALWALEFSLLHFPVTLIGTCYWTKLLGMQTTFLCLHFTNWTVSPAPRHAVSIYFFLISIYLINVSTDWFKSISSLGQANTWDFEDWLVPGSGGLRDDHELTMPLSSSQLCASIFKWGKGTHRPRAVSY